MTILIACVSLFPVLNFRKWKIQYKTLGVPAIPTILSVPQEFYGLANKKESPTRLR